MGLAQGSPIPQTAALRYHPNTISSIPVSQQCHESGCKPHQVPEACCKTGIPMPWSTAQPRPLLADGYITLPEVSEWNGTHPHPNPPAVLLLIWRAEPHCTHLPGFSHQKSQSKQEHQEQIHTPPPSVQIPSSAALPKDTFCPASSEVAVVLLSTTRRSNTSSRISEVISNRMLSG